MLSLSDNSNEIFHGFYNYNFKSSIKNSMLHAVVCFDESLVQVNYLNPQIWRTLQELLCSLRHCHWGGSFHPKKLLEVGCAQGAPGEGWTGLAGWKRQSVFQKHKSLRLVYILKLYGKKCRLVVGGDVGLGLFTSSLYTRIWMQLQQRKDVYFFSYMGITISTCNYIQSDEISSF